MNANLEANQDVPEAPWAATSSIGGLWPPEPSSFARLKGIYTPEILETREQLKDFVDFLEETSHSQFSLESPAITRVSLRSVVRAEILSSSSSASSLEAIIPLEGTQPAFEGTVLAYWGKNHSSRAPYAEELQGYRNAVKNILSSVSPRSPQEIFQRSHTQGYQLEVLDPAQRSSNKTLGDELTLLYQRFGWERQQVQAIVENPHALLSIARYRGAIVSTALAETAKIPIGNQTLRIAEITEAATAEEHAGNGLYTAVSSTLLQAVTQRSLQGDLEGGEVDYLFGECNGNASGVLKTSRIQGRTFATEVGMQRGFPSSGVLLQHVPIAGMPRQTAYNDLFPSFISREQLYRTWRTS